MKKLNLIFGAVYSALVVSNNVFAEVLPDEAASIIFDSSNLIKNKKYEQARKLLAKNSFPIMDAEIERLHLIAQTYIEQNKLREAIVIYKYILDNQPELSKVRAELAVLYIKQKDWYRAEYNLKLALSDKKIPPHAKKDLQNLLYLIRQNKNWDIWFNFGVLPDSNPGMVRGGEECFEFMKIKLCRELPEPDKVIGIQANIGGNYEWKFNKNWGLKSDVSIYSNTFNKSEYNDLSTIFNIGPRYVYKKGEVWTSANFGRRYYGKRGYNTSVGPKITTSYDFNHSTYANLLLQYSKIYYEDYGDFMDGDITKIVPQIGYIINSSTFTNLSFQFQHEDTKDLSYTNDTYGISFGFGTEMLFGFRIYIEPSISLVYYYDDRLVIQDNKLQFIKEKNNIYGYSATLSNNKLDFYGFTPAIVYQYFNRDSNIFDRDISRQSVQIMIQKKF